MKIVKIGIRFGDNDFAKTVCAFLELFIDSRAMSDRMHSFYAEAYPDRVLGPTKARIVEVFNAMAHWVCLIRQDGWTESAEDRTRHEKYLKIAESNVYFDDEVDKHLEKCGCWDNDEFHYVDAEQNKVFSA